MMVAHALYNKDLEEFLVLEDNIKVAFENIKAGQRYVTVGIDLASQELNYVFHEIISMLVEGEGELDATKISLVPIIETSDGVEFDFLSELPLSEVLIVKGDIEDG